MKSTSLLPLKDQLLAKAIADAVGAEIRAILDEYGYSPAITIQSSASKG